MTGVQTCALRSPRRTTTASAQHGLPRHYHRNRSWDNHHQVHIFYPPSRMFFHLFSEVLLICASPVKAHRPRSSPPGDKRSRTTVYASMMALSLFTRHCRIRCLYHQEKPHLLICGNKFGSALVSREEANFG